MTGARTATDIIVLCENVLGWLPQGYGSRPVHMIRRDEAGRLKRAMSVNPKKYTVGNLELAVEYSRRKQLPIKSPLVLIYRVDDALELANEDSPLSDVGQAIQDAVNVELASDRPDADTWISRLTRASGPYRDEVLTEWKEAGRGGL